MIKPKLYKGGSLEGKWDFGRKLDGVRMLRNSKGEPVSREGKPLYNLSHLPSNIKDAEIFCEDWNKTVSMVRTHHGDPVDLQYVYSLDPIDPRLQLGSFVNPTEELVNEHLDRQVSLGDEGLVIRQGSKWLKVKKFENCDVRIIGLLPGTGQFRGKLGAFITNYGSVGTGFTPQERGEMNNNSMIGQIIEVRYMGLTKNGKFRHPSLVRVRWDKDEESLPDA